MTCPNCQQALTAEHLQGNPECSRVMASAVALYSAAKRVTKSGGRNGGRPVTCACGSCAKCIRRAKKAAQ